MTPEPKFYTRGGWLTDYALRFGYIHGQKDRDVILCNPVCDERIYAVVIAKSFAYAMPPLPLDPSFYSYYSTNAAAHYWGFTSIKNAREFFKSVCGDLETHYEPRLKREVIS